METSTKRSRSVAPAAASTWQLVGGLTALALLTRLLLLAHKSFWLDEAASYFITRLDPAAFRHALWSRELNMALYYVLLRAWMLLGASDWILRLPSVLAATATIPVVYALGNRLFSRRVGLWSALLLTLSASHIAYAQEARGYALAILWVALSSLFFVRALPFAPRTLDRRSSPWNWVAYVLCSVAAVYTHFFAVLVIAAQWVCLLAWPREPWPWRRLAFSALALAAALLPALWFVLHRTSDQLAWVPKLNFTTVFKTSVLLAGNSVAVPAYVFLWWKSIRTMRARQAPFIKAWPVVFISVWLWLPFALVFLASLHRPILFPRFLLISLPAAVLLAAAGLEKLRPDRQQLAVFVVIVLSVGGIIYYYARHQEDWRGATAYVLQHGQPGDAVFVGPNYGYLGYEYYQRLHPASGVVLHLPDDLTGSAHFPRIWLLLYGKKTEPDSALLLSRIERDNRLVSTQQFSHIDAYLYVPK